MEDKIADDQSAGLDPWTAAVRVELSAHAPVYTHALDGGQTLTVQAGLDSLWLVVRGGSGSGVAFRAAYAPSGIKIDEAALENTSVRLTLTAPCGRFAVAVDVSDTGLLHWATTLTPAYDLTLPFSPPDVYPVDPNGDPAGASGTAHAGQPSVGAATVFLSENDFGSALYLHNFSALNPLFAALGTKPAGIVGGKWPQLGLSLPASESPLPAGETRTVADVFVRVSPEVPQNERDAARLFLECLAAIYPRLPQPKTEWRDWPARAADSVVDLEHGDGCLVTKNGHAYALPYLDAEEPDSMVQLCLLLPLMEYAEWTGQPVPLADKLRAGVPAFFDPTLGAMRRYLPGTDGKDLSESDSWYLYHPLLDLARLAKRGDAEAKDLLFASLEHAIQAGQHFEYRWPVKFHLETLETLTAVRKPDEPGQSDVGGIYAAVMIEAWDLSGDDRYLEEAKAAIQALTGYRFAVGYQLNITAIGAAACLRLFETTRDDFYRDQSLLLLASFFHHTTFYDCSLGTAQYFPAFLSVQCLHDAEYAAIFEAFESLAAFHQMFEHSGDALPESARLLITEYCRCLLNRAWYYYPGELPEDALAKEVRNGRLDQNLAVPMEDLYPLGDPAGAVGQEIYGAGAAFAFATRSFRRLPDCPFTLFCDYPVTVLTTDPACASLRVHGVPTANCRLKLIAADSNILPAVTVRLGAHDLPGSKIENGQQEYTVPGGTDIELRW